MDQSEKPWRMQPQEQEGDYWFNGQFYITRGVKKLLTEDEIYWIYIEVQTKVREHEGIDYLAVFKKPDDETKLFFIDQLTKVQVDNEQFSIQDHYCTLMLASEY